MPDAFQQTIITGFLKNMLLISPILAALLGLIIGSFLNVVIHRGPAMWKLVDDDSRRGNLAFPRSYCAACHAPIARAHLVPLAGYVALRGKCALCSAPISIRYPIVELLGAAAALGAYLLFGTTVSAFLAAIFFWFLIALAAIDLETGFLPDALTLPLIAIGFAANTAGFFAPLTDVVIGAATGYLVFWVIGALFQRLRGMEGLGQGDAKLLAALAAWLGWQAIAPVVFVAALTALAGIFVMRLAGRETSNTTPIPFGPALAFSGALIMTVAAIAPESSYVAVLLPIFP